MTLAHLGLLRVLPAFIAVMTVADVEVGAGHCAGGSALRG